MCVAVMLDFKCQYLYMFSIVLLFFFLLIKCSLRYLKLWNFKGSNCKCCFWFQRFCADVVSVLAMTMSGERECLKYRLLGSQEELASWGHEYVR